MTRFQTIRELVDIQVAFFCGSDYLDPEGLEKSEYFRGQVEMVGDMVGGCDAKDALWAPLKEACAASARNDAELESFVQKVMEAAEQQAQSNGFSLQTSATEEVEFTAMALQDGHDEIVFEAGGVRVTATRSQDDQTVVVTVDEPTGGPSEINGKPVG